MVEPLKTRFAPSPTGWLRFGNIRTALFNYLLARGAGGVLLRRIEDTDATRGHEQYERALLQELEWLGLAWDEGPVRGGRAARYRQSERGEVSRRDFAELETAGLAYGHRTDFRSLSGALAGETGFAGKRLYRPLRAALTRELDGPKWRGDCPLIGPEPAGKRLQRAIEAAGA